jgi:hypothetical protein
VKSKIFAVAGLLCSAFGVWAQSSAFTYQGQLISNSIPATGQFDLRFALFNDLSAGSQIGAPLTNSPTGVTNGLFLVTLDFGSSVFDGGQRWLEIGVRTNGSTNVFTTLAPRQLLTATPYAVRAANYTGILGATNITGKINDLNLSANVALLTNNATFLRTVTASNFTGDAYGLLNVPATSLIGTVPDARLSTNVAFRNTSNTVFLGALTATNFNGDGHGLTNVPGRIGQTFPTGVNIQAYPTFGYLATNDTTPVVVTLPPTAGIDVGATIRVSGSGAAGWVVAQNASQKILTANLLRVTGGAWRNALSSAQWRAVAASGDGQKLVAVINPGVVYTSSDYGMSWGPGGASANWTATAVSGNGAYVFTASSPGVLGSYTKNWSALACSASGQYVLAGATGEYLYRSSNYGASWLPMLTDAGRSWTGVASSGDGVNLVACAIGANLFVSTNSGSGWTLRASIQQWSCVAGAANGGTFVAGVNNGQLYVSYDSGTSWIPTATAQAWTSVSCSADGTRMIATYGGASGGVYVSQDAGVSWQLHGNLTSADFRGAAVSGDGSTTIAAGTATPLYVSSQTSTTVGVAGQLIGARYASVELQHIGNGVFMPISYVGTIRAK